MKIKHLPGIVLILLACHTAKAAAPSLSLLEGSGFATSDQITEGTASYLLDVVLNTGGNNVSGIQFWIETTGPGSVSYSLLSTITVLDNPFTAADAGLEPAAGAIVSQSAKTSFFKQNPTPPAYPSFAANAIVRLQFNTGSLATGSYVFTPVGEEMTTEIDSITIFGPAGTFALEVVPVPEPATWAVFALGIGCVLVRLRKAISGRPTDPATCRQQWRLWASR